MNAIQVLDSAINAVDLATSGYPSKYDSYPRTYSRPSALMLKYAGIYCLRQDPFDDGDQDLMLMLNRGYKPFGMFAESAALATMAGYVDYNQFKGQAITKEQYESVKSIFIGKGRDCIYLYDSGSQPWLGKKHLLKYREKLCFFRAAIAPPGCEFRSVFLGGGL